MSHSKVSIPGPNSQSNLTRVSENIAKPNYSGLFGISIERAEGCHIFDMDGNKYLDCISAASTNILGYGNIEVVQAYSNAALSMQHSLFAYSPNKHAVPLAEKLISLVPGKFDKRVMFGLSGSDACDGAIKAMRSYTKIKGIAHFKNDYHGSTGLSMPASDYASLNDGLFVPDAYFKELIFPKNEEEGQAVLGKIENWLQNGEIGGVLAEAIQGDAGIICAPKGFYEELIKLLHSFNAVLAIDEVQSGMGRTGLWWAIEHENIEPDLLITAKGLSGGYAPISAVIGRTEILNSLNNSQHVFTYSGHAPSAAAALVVLNEIEKHQYIEKNRKNGEFLIQSFENLKAKYPELIAEVRGKGLMLGIAVKIKEDSLLGKTLATRCVEKGLYVGFFGVKGNVIRIEPPFTLQEEDFNTIINILDEVFCEWVNNEIPLETYENVKKYSVGL